MNSFANLLMVSEESPLIVEPKIINPCVSAQAVFVLFDQRWVLSRPGKLDKLHNLKVKISACESPYSYQI